MKRHRVPVGKPAPESAKPRSGAEPGSEAARAPAWKHALALAAVIGFTLLAYANSFHAPFLLDNDAIILKDTRIHAVTPLQIHRILTEQYWATGNNGLYRPLSTLSFLLDYAVLGHGEDPTGYHWFNFLLHAANIVLVYLLGLAIFERIPPALLLSALWGVHPVLTESVTNIVGRSDMLAAFSVLAALLCHRQAIASVGARKAAWLAAIALAAAIGVFSKESAIVIVAVFAVYDVTFGDPKFARAAWWRSRIPSYAAAAIPCLVYLYVRSQALGHASFQETGFCENPLVGAGFWTARITAIKVIGKSFALLVWPARLSWDYSYNAIPLFGWNLGNWEDWKAIAALLGCAAAAVAAILSWRNRKAVLFAVAFFFVAISPTANLVLLIGTIMGERLLYLPAVGFTIAAVWALHSLWQRVPAARPAYRYAAGAALGVVLLALAARTYARNADWDDPQRFWLSAVAAAPGSYKANMTAATNKYLVTQEDVDQSLVYCDRTLAMLDGLPDLQNAPNAYSDAALFYRNLGDRLASLAADGKAPAGSDPLSWYRKALHALLRSERIEIAQDRQFRAENALRGKPGVTSMPSKLYLDLGRIYLRLSDRPHALAAFERGRTLESSPDILEELATLYRAAGEERQAAQALVEAMAVDPGRTRLAGTLVELYSQIDPQGCAVSVEAGVRGLNPGCPLVHGDICAASRNVIGNYLRRGQQFEAAAIRKVAEEDLACDAGLLN